MIVALPARMRIREASELRSFLDDRLGLLGEQGMPGVSGPEERAPCRLDGAGVEAVDSAGLQLLLAFLQAVEERGHAFAWQGASEVLMDAARTLGMLGMLGLRDLAPDGDPARRAPGGASARAVGGAFSGMGHP